MVRKALLTTSVAGASIALLLPTAALAQQDRVSGPEKGSVLIFPKVEVRWNDSDEVIQDTFVHLTNDYPDDVSVKLFFVNGDPPIFCEDGGSGEGIQAPTGLETEGHDCDRDHPGWNYLDNVIELTSNQPVYWSAATGDPAGVSPWRVLDPGPPPGRPDPDSDERFLRGYIVAFAIAGVSGNEISWNHLAGDATVVNYDNESAFRYSAYAFQTVAAAHGEETGSPGELNLDGAEYAPGFSHLLMNFIASGSDAYDRGFGKPIEHDTDLTLLPISSDFRQEGDGPRTTKVTFDIWNENERKFTNLDRCVTCWDQELLSNYEIPNHFMVEALQTDAGKARMDGVESQLCLFSTDESLLGITVHLLGFFEDEELDDVAAAAVSLTGMGTESGVIHYDAQGPPPPGRWIPPNLGTNEMVDYLMRGAGD